MIFMDVLEIVRNKSVIYIVQKLSSKHLYTFNKEKKWLTVLKLLSLVLVNLVEIFNVFLF